MTARFALLPFLLLLGACSQVTTKSDPKIALVNFKHLYVIHLLTDGRGVDQAIARELRHRGYDARFGPRTEMPAETEAVILYQDRWTFDFTSYMIGLNIEVRTPHTDKALALGTVFNPSITGHTTADVVKAVLKKLFPAKSPLPDLPPPAPDA